MEEKEMGRKRTPEEEARRELIRELLSKANVTGMEDIQTLFKETIAELLGTALTQCLRKRLVNRRAGTAVSVTASLSTSTAVPIDNLIVLCYYE